MKHLEFTIQSSDGLDLYAQSWQVDGEPRAVVCLTHGLGEHSGRYTHLGEFLNRAGYSVFAFDLRGHGRSAGPRGHSPSYEMLMSDIERFLAEVKVRFPKAPRILYGHSMGGNLVLNFVLRKSPALAGVIASSPALRMAFDPPAWKLSLGKVLYSAFPGFTMSNGLVREHLSRVPRIVETYKKDILVHDKITARMALDVLQAGEWAIDHAVEFSLPLLLMHGGADQITSTAASQVFAQAVGEWCEFKIWDGLYHEIHNEPEQELVFSFILDWLKALLHANTLDS